MKYKIIDENNRVEIQGKYRVSFLSFTVIDRNLSPLTVAAIHTTCNGLAPEELRR
jgi:hypothetical protein